MNTWTNVPEAELARYESGAAPLDRANANGIGVANVASAAVNTASNVASDVASGVSSAASTAAQTLSNVGSDIANTASKAWDSLFN